jgi:hypothetical protein
MIWLSTAALAVPLPGRVDCDALAVVAAAGEPATVEQAWEVVTTANLCNRVEPHHPMPPLDGFGPLVASAEIDPQSLASTGSALYAFGASLAVSSLVAIDDGLALQAQALDLVAASGAQPTELVALDDRWRFEQGPSAAWVGEAALIRQVLARESLSRRDRHACEDFATWLDQRARPVLGLPFDVQLAALDRALAESPPENRSCAAGFAAAWPETAARAAEVRSRVVALTRPAVVR